MQARSSERLASVFTACCAVAVAAAYLRNLRAGPFADDFGWVRMGFAAIQRGRLGIWYDALDCFFFRPFNIAIVAESMRAGTWALAHGVALSVNVVMGLMVGWLAIRIHPDRDLRWLGLAAGCAFFAHQANTTTVLQLDTLSQSMSDLFAVVALVAAVLYVRSSRRWLLVSAVASVGAMLGKEGGISVPVAAVVTVLVLSPRPARVGKAAYMLLAQLGASAVYVVWRLSVLNLVPLPAELQPRYGFAVGLTTIHNFARFIFIEGVPWNSASLMAGRKPQEWAIGLALGGLMLLVAGLGWKRLLRERPGSRALLVWLVAVFLVWCTPYVFLIQVSEQEAYRLTAVTVLAVGMGCWALLRSADRRLALLAVVVWCAWVFTGSVGSIEKSNMLRHNSEVATELLDEAEAALGDISRTDTVRVFMVPAEHPPRTYSILSIPDVTLRVQALWRLDTRLRKPGLTIEHMEPGREPPDTLSSSPGLKTLRVDVEHGSVELVPR
jgi:hypothetical protein